MSKFKVGDKVIANKEFICGEKTDGLTFEVLETNDTTFYGKVKKIGAEMFFTHLNYDDFYLAPVPKFKVGQRYRVAMSDGVSMVDDIIEIEEIGIREYSFRTVKGKGFRKGNNFELIDSDFTRNLKLISEPQKSITINVYGNKTVAKLYEGDKVIKTRIARCCPDDEFNFEIGAKIAVDRLLENNTFDWNAFRNGKIAVNVETQGEYNKFMMMCQKNGFRWNDRSLPTEFNGFYINEETSVIGTKALGLMIIAEETDFTPYGAKIIKFSSFGGKR